MSGIRVKVTPTVEPGGAILTRLEWLEVEDGVVGKVLHVEEWRTMPPRAGSGYVSSVEVHQADVLGGTFWIDEQGHKHHILSAEAGQVAATLSPLGG